MQLTNSTTHYGAITRFLHWSVFLLLVHQYLGANLMTRIESGKTLFWLTQNSYYHGHKSIGLAVLVLVVLRFAWRKLTPLPDWAPTLTPAERTISHWNENLLYGCLLLMPVSGYLFVMAGDYGIKLFGGYDLPNPIGKQEGLAILARIVHIVIGYVTVIVVAWHVGLGLKHQIFDRDRFLDRMLPFVRR
ncbi:MAG: cytochrome b [Candidatus Competibacteraceae bacterium]|nr:cytochrome b [Candidatus Competibacteraceae bacterium]